MRRFLTLLLGLTLGCGLLFGQGIDFRPMSLEDAISASAREHKPVLFMAYQKTCGHCEKMINEVFPDTLVSNFYNANYISVRVDMLDQNEAKKYLGRFNIGSFPTFVILNEKSEVLSQFVGEFKPGDFVKQGKLALDPKQQLPYLRTQFEANPADSVATYNYLLALSRGRLSTQPIANQYFAANGNRLDFSAYNWKIVSMSVSDMQSPVFKYMVANKDSFAVLATMKKVERKFYLTAAYNMQMAISMNDSTNYFKQRGYSEALHLKLVDSLIFVNDLNIFEKNKLWDRYVQTARNGAELYVWTDYNLLRRIADNIYQYSNDKSTLQKGANCAARSAELNPDYFSNLSAAKIYQKMGYTDMAKKYAQKAVDEGSKKNMNVTEAARIAGS